MDSHIRLLGEPCAAFTISARRLPKPCWYGSGQRGSVFDVAVDVRHGSRTYGHHWAGVLSADEWNQVVIPEGFAHGYCTLEAECAVQYKMTTPYSSEHDGGILWNDPDLGIEWPIEPKDAVVSERDKTLPLLRDLPAPGDDRRQ